MNPELFKTHRSLGLSGMVFDASSVASAVVASLGVLWGIKKAIELVLRPSKFELFQYSYTIKSKRKNKKSRFRKVYKKEYLLSNSRMQEITRYLFEKNKSKPRHSEERTIGVTTERR